MMTSKERAELRAQANTLDTILMVGKGGVSETLIAEAEKVLDARELVKGRVLESAMMSAREVCDAICEQTGAEGCLSVPGEYGIVTRPSVVTVRAQDRDGSWFEYTGTGLTARCICHELDHLDGHLFTEKCERMLTEEEMSNGEY